MKNQSQPILGHATSFLGWRVLRALRTLGTNFIKLAVQRYKTCEQMAYDAFTGNRRPLIEPDGILNYSFLKRTTARNTLVRFMSGKSRQCVVSSSIAALLLAFIALFCRPIRPCRPNLVHRGAREGSPFSLVLRFLPRPYDA
jgi:hypothetical protein